MPEYNKPKKQSAYRNRLITVLLVIVLLLASIVVLWIYNKDSTLPLFGQQTPTTAQTTEPEAPADGTPDKDLTTAQTFKIPELGIQMILTEGLEGLLYEADLASEPYDGFVNLGTQQLDKANDDSSYCTVSYAPLGTLARYKHNPNESTVASGPTKIVKLQSGDYIAFTHPQQGCTANASLGELQDEQIKLLEKSLDSITEIR